MKVFVYYGNGRTGELEIDERLLQLAVDPVEMALQELQPFLKKVMHR